MYDLIQELERYVPFNEQEEKDKEEMLYRLKHEDVYTRDNRGAHLTASAWIVNQDRTKVLMCWHKIYRSWSWLGGHCDGERDPRVTALREVREESGLKHIRLCSEDIFSIEILTVDGHIKNGAYVSSHLHLNITYLIEADAHEPLRIKADENAGLKWFDKEDALRASSEPWFVEHIYRKLNEKLAEIK